MDWVAAALRRIVQFTQAGGEINIVVSGINVGAQPYWNAEATMLMHTKGILVMTPDSAMVLTGKQSLDFSGGVSAEDNFGIGGYDRVMGPTARRVLGAETAAARDVLIRTTSTRKCAGRRDARGRRERRSTGSLRLTAPRPDAKSLRSANLLRPANRTVEDFDIRT